MPADLSSTYPLPNTYIDIDRGMTMVVFQKSSLIILGFITTLLLNACGGGGGDDDDVMLAQPPQTSNTPTIRFQQVKKFTFTWDDVDDAFFYRLLEDPDGDSGFSQIGNDIQSGRGEISIQVPIYRRINARYILQSCNSIGCTNSISVSVSGNLEKSIGYFKPNNQDNLTLDQNNKQFGSAVALSSNGNVMAVSAPDDNANKNGNTISNAGVVYIFTRSSDGFFWELDDTVSASNAERNDYFGSSVALSADGKTLVVGAYGEDNGLRGINNPNLDNGNASLSGAAYVFRKINENWQQEAYIKASNASKDDWFGEAVTISADGNTVVVGAFRESSDPEQSILVTDDDSYPGSGAIYIFTRNTDNWEQEAFIKASNFEAEDFFGSSLSISADGNTLVVGAPRENSNGTGINSDQLNNSKPNSGAAYIFVRNNRIWTQEFYFKASNTDSDDNFGSSVSISADGETIAIGADRESSNATGIDVLQTDNSSLFAGAVYIFVKSGGDWTQTNYIKASNTDSGDEFGRSVALSSNGDILFVGAWEEDSSSRGIEKDQNNNNQIDSGAVYVFDRLNNNWSQVSYIKATNPGEDNYFGEIAISADGETLAVGAFGERGESSGIGGEQSNSLSGASNGAVYLY